MMNCEELRCVLLDFVDGDLPPEEKAGVRAHLAECTSCRAEVDQLRAGARAVRAAVEELAPRQHYLTGARLERLMAARRERRRPIKLITPRRLVAAAAIAAIVASAPFLVGDFARLLAPPPETTQQGAVAQAPVLEWHGPAILAATGRQAPMSVMRSVPAAAEGPAIPGPGVSLATSDTEGVRVPVQNVLYDPEESSHWW
jgi:anti-sigma factor RsiW